MGQAVFQNQPVYELRDGESHVFVAPQFGARLLQWTIGSQPIIHWPENSDWSSVETVAKTRGGNPILFPFLGRHFVDGTRELWRDEKGVVRDMPMHGFARDLPFEVVEAGDTQIRMRLETTKQTRELYPFDFRFDVVYRLTGNILETTFETSSTGKASLPYYAGHHFYFSIPHQERANWQIELPCRTWGRQNPDGSPQLYPAENTTTTLANPDIIDRFHLDFEQPCVTLTNTANQRQIEVSWDQVQSHLWYDVTTWTSAPESDFYCVEPWLGLPDAIHHKQGLRILASGQTEFATCRITAS